ncbi:ferredoxin-type protein NapF [Aminobacter sp. AP02]|uniref:ferredoxin-type protein NapF n=1 Tax=Aminobacter sp. AP02 TaxID=2135737 RepID=UPI000D6C6700|nr:ferredoxin-type protein NapF [Aminobacter sp. AP02]
MTNPASISRRTFLTGGNEQPVQRIVPPGVMEDGLGSCTGCGACVEACPTAIIAMVAGKPSLDFMAGECLLCGDCATACPELVFDRASTPVFSHVVAISDDCLARNGISCMTCRDACPQAAISFRPRIGGPFLPELREAACTGCGACIAPCPARAIAIARQLAEAAHA